MSLDVAIITAKRYPPICKRVPCLESSEPPHDVIIDMTGKNQALGWSR